MNESILSDLFSFVSTDGQLITKKNLSDFEIFINRNDFEDLHEDLIGFLNDLIYFTVNKLDIKVDVVDEGLINKKAISKIKNQKNGKNSYKGLYKKNIEFKKIKTLEIKKCYRNLLFNKNIKFNINTQIFLDFFNFDGNIHREVILKFVTRLRQMIVDKRKTSMQNLKKNYRTENETSKTADEISFPGGLNSSKNKNNLTFDKSNDNKSSHTCLSDNEIVMKNKVNFLKVLKGVTTNMIKNFQEEGKNFTITIEPNVMPEIEMIISQKKETIDTKDIKVDIKPPENENEIAVEVDDKKTQEKKTVNEGITKITDETGNNNKVDKNKRIHEEGCKCKCFIF